MPKDKGVRDWVEDLIHEDPRVRDDAGRYLAGLGAAAAPCLVELLDSPVPGVRAWAGETLLAIGPAAVPTLLEAASMREGRVKQQASRLLRRLRVA